MEEYKGKKVHLDKFKWEETKGNDSSVKKFFYYEGYVSDEDVPHGTGKMTEESRDYVREGEWENGEFVKGTYSTPYTQRYLGSFRSSLLEFSLSFFVGVFNKLKFGRLNFVFSFSFNLSAFIKGKSS